MTSDDVYHSHKTAESISEVTYNDLITIIIKKDIFDIITHLKNSIQMTNWGFEYLGSINARPVVGNLSSTKEK
jgi:hypothetical protein